MEAGTQHTTDKNPLIVQQLTPMWIRNAVANEATVRRHRNVADLFGRAAGFPAILVASGPSLDRNIRQLKDLQNQAVIIACDSAYRPLLEAGCRPHIVVSLDPKPSNASFFDGTLAEQKHTLFVCATVVHPDVVRSWGYDIFFFNPSPDGDVQMWDALPYLVGNLGSLIVGGHVLSVATVLALSGLKCSPIAFVGADYCWYDNKRHHVAGASVAKFSGEINEATDIFGRRVYQSAPLRMYQTWMQAVLGDGVVDDYGEEVEIINCTEGGVFAGERIQQQPLAWFAQKHLTRNLRNVADRLRRVA